MRILAPYTRRGLHPDTRRALEALPPDEYQVEFAEMTDGWSYHKAFNRYWRSGEGFIIVEHDLIPTKEHLDELVRCPEGWCTQPYTHPYHEAKHHTAIFEAFGVVKFEGWFVSAHPTLTDDMLDISKTHNKFARWIQLDSRFLSCALGRGLDRHKHGSIVPHWHWDVFGIIIDVSDLESWNAKYKLPWEIVADLNPHLPSRRLEECWGELVHVHYCRPLPDQLYILDWEGNVVWDPTKGGDYSTSPLSPEHMTAALR